MPHDERVAAIEALRNALWHAWMQAGARSYKEIEIISEIIFGHDRRLTTSTTHEILTGNPPGRLPRWYWISRYWTVMREIAVRNHRDPDSIGSLDAWEQLHEAARAAPRQSHEMAAVPGPEAGRHPRPALVTEYTPEPDSVPQQRIAAGPGTESGPDGERLRSILQAIGVEWWGDYSDVVPSSAGPYLSLEAAAQLIHCYETAVVPGLLQTAAYAEAVLRVVDPTLPDTAIIRMVRLRMRRQRILTKSNPPRVWAVFDETALRRELGDASIMMAQIRRLIEISRLPNVTIQVIPAVTRIRTALGYPITLLSFPVNKLPNVIYLEQLTTAIYLHDPQHVSRYSKLLTGLSTEALSPAETLRFLHRMLREPG